MTIHTTKTVMTVQSNSHSPLWVWEQRSRHSVCWQTHWRGPAEERWPSPGPFSGRPGRSSSWSAKKFEPCPASQRGRCHSNVISNTNLFFFRFHFEHMHIWSFQTYLPSAGTKPMPVCVDISQLGEAPNKSSNTFAHREKPSRPPFSSSVLWFYTSQLLQAEFKGLRCQWFFWPCHWPCWSCWPHQPGEPSHPQHC